MKVEKMISFEEAENKAVSLGGLGGFFVNGMRWKDYIETIPNKNKEYAEAFREYILKNNIKHGGDWHQNSLEGVPLFNDGTVGTFSYRAWGDIMAAVWSEKENTDYHYMNFHMEEINSTEKANRKLSECSKGENADNPDKCDCCGKTKVKDSEELPCGINEEKLKDCIEDATYKAIASHIRRRWQLIGGVFLGVVLLYAYLF